MIITNEVNSLFNKPHNYRHPFWSTLKLGNIKSTAHVFLCDLTVKKYDLPWFEKFQVLKILCEYPYPQNLMHEISSKI